MSTDDDLWEEVIRNIKPLPQKKRVELPKPINKRSVADKIRENRLNERPLFIKTDNLKVTFVKTDYFSKKKIENRIDLHGMTCQEAEKALDAFFYKAQHLGYKTVLIITGKGTPKNDHPPSLYGVLRSFTCQWIESHPYYCVCYSIARADQGADGAFYVHVRPL